ncbi:unnamed protein product [Amoebophrya sp. A25]|nr:unnamed protein product [Amoebophrya sp. A25]|eukprot:GSA25T00026431001.1
MLMHFLLAWSLIFFTFLLPMWWLCLPCAELESSSMDVMTHENSV